MSDAYWTISETHHCLTSIKPLSTGQRLDFIRKVLLLLETDPSIPPSALSYVTLAMVSVCDALRATAGNRATAWLWPTPQCRFFRPYWMVKKIDMRRPQSPSPKRKKAPAEAGAKSREGVTQQGGAVTVSPQRGQSGNGQRSGRRTKDSRLMFRTLRRVPGPTSKPSTWRTFQAHKRTWRTLFAGVLAYIAHTPL